MNWPWRINLLLLPWQLAYAYFQMTQNRDNAPGMSGEFPHWWFSSENEQGAPRRKQEFHTLSKASNVNRVSWIMSSLSSKHPECRLLLIYLFKMLKYDFHNKKWEAYLFFSVVFTRSFDVSSPPLFTPFFLHPEQGVSKMNARIQERVRLSSRRVRLQICEGDIYHLSVVD